MLRSVFKAVSSAKKIRRQGSAERMELPRGNFTGEVLYFVSDVGFYLLEEGIFHGR